MYFICYNETVCKHGILTFAFKITRKNNYNKTNESSSNQHYHSAKAIFIYFRTQWTWITDKIYFQNSIILLSQALPGVSAKAVTLKRFGNLDFILKALKSILNRQLELISRVIEQLLSKARGATRAIFELFLIVLLQCCKV